MVSQGDQRTRPRRLAHAGKRPLAARGSVVAPATTGAEYRHLVAAPAERRHPGTRAGGPNGQGPGAALASDSRPRTHTEPRQTPSGPTAGRWPNHKVITQAVIVVGILALVASLIVVLRAPTGTHPASPATPAIASTSNDVVLTRALRDGAAARWTHMMVSSAVGAQSVSVTATLGVSVGQEAIASGKNSASLVVTARAAYFRANGAAAMTLLHLPSSYVAGPANGWSPISSTDAGYRVALGETTLAGVLRTELSFVGPTKVGSRTVVLAQRVTPITGRIRIPGTNETQAAVLDVTDTSRPLPLELNSSGPSFSETITFGSWGVAAAIEAPTGTTSSAKTGSHTGSAR
jgi:hypothetical protein